MIVINKLYRMKKYKTTGLFVAVMLTMISCSEDYVEPDFKTKSFAVYASFFSHGSGGANINPTYKNTYSIEGMMDISQGFESHEWSFWENAGQNENEIEWKEMIEGVKFLKKNSNLSWSTTDYTPYLDHELKPRNSQDNITFYFEKGGHYAVRIQNIYDVQVEYMLREDERNVYYQAEPMENGKYIVERMYEFEVYDSLYAKAKIYDDAACQVEVNIGADSILTIQPGRTLYFRDATGSTKFDSGTSRQWDWSYITTSGQTTPSPIPMVEPQSATDSIAGFTFPEKGLFTVKLTVKRDAKEDNSKFPSGQNAKTIPIIINVE